MLSSGLVFVGASHIWHWCAAAAPPQLAQEEQHRTLEEASAAEPQRSLQSTSGRKKILVNVNGQPKSGTTWMGVTLAQVVKDWCGRNAGCKLSPGADNHPDDVVATLPSGLRRIASTEHKHNVPIVGGHGGGIDWIMPPRVSEEKLQAAAHKLVKENDWKRYAAVFRDPRDVAVSACHYKPKQSCGTVQKLPEYMHKVMGRLCGWINLRYRLFRAVQSLAPYRVGLFFYEEMFEDEAAAIKTMGNLFEIEMTEGQVEAVLNKTTFSAMHEKAANSSVGLYGGTKRVRKGGYCGFKKELQDETARAITKLMRGALVDDLSNRWHC